jgi:hypothetical protein
MAVVESGPVEVKVVSKTASVVTLVVVGGGLVALAAVDALRAWWKGKRVRR